MNNGRQNPASAFKPLFLSFLRRTPPAIFLASHDIGSIPLGGYPECMPHVIEKKAQSNTFHAELRGLSSHTASATEALGKAIPLAYSSVSICHVQTVRIFASTAELLKCFGRGGAVHTARPVFAFPSRRRTIPRKVYGSVMSPTFECPVPCTFQKYVMA